VHVSKEFLLEAVGLSLLVALLLISMQMFQKATKITMLLEENQERQIAELEEYEITKYDGIVLDGITALNYAKKMTGTYKLPVIVTTIKGEFSVIGQTDYEEMRNIISEKYVNPLAKYRCELVRDENAVIAEIRITEERKVE